MHLFCRIISCFRTMLSYGILGPLGLGIIVAQKGRQGVMERQQVLEALCVIAREVQYAKFHYAISADCFCGLNKMTWGNYEFSPQVIDFIREAVNEKLAREAKD
jgi:hypothetical protein